MAFLHILFVGVVCFVEDRDGEVDGVRCAEVRLEFICVVMWGRRLGGV